MLGLLGTLNLASRSLQTQRQGVEVAGHNIANVNNTGYARQRLNLSATAVSTPGESSQGTGVQAGAVIQLRNSFLDQQIQLEQSVRGSLEARQDALEQAQSSLGTLLGTSGTNLGTDLSDLFNAFESAAANPADTASRQVLLGKAAALADRFNKTDARLAAINSGLDKALTDDVAHANDLLGEIGDLSGDISRAEASGTGAAHDLRDTRLQKLEELSKLVKIDVTESDSGALTVSTGGTALIGPGQPNAALESYPGGVRVKGTPGPLELTSGHMAGLISGRDGEVENLRAQLNTIASTLITEVNKVHSGGSNLNGGTGEAFFAGTGAADIRVSQKLFNDSKLVQLAEAGGAAGNNKNALALANLANTNLVSLNNLTFNGRFAEQVTTISQALSTTKSQLEDQDRVEQLLNTQRSSVSGVSLDEEMTDLVKFQKAFEASARLMTTVDEMLETVINLKR